jgi:dTDP-4-dehydrorhamnose 3,5-epimerase
MNEQWQHAPLNGVRVFCPAVARDRRGLFVKTYHQGQFAEQGVNFETREEFFSISGKNVLRGMHFQIPPHDHAKLVTCLRGRILDVLVDLRRSEPTYRTAWSAELTEENRRVLYIPSGLAHGFLSLTDDALVHYKTTTVHSPEHDAGIRWDSFGFPWPTANPVLSARDAAFPVMNDFESPFA